MKQFERFRLDTANECLWRESEQIAIPPKAFAVLRYLVENPGRLITHDELMDALWPETFVQPQVLRTYMLDLRKALGDDAGQPRFIQTLPKRGYSFVAAVSDCVAVTPGAAVQAAKQSGFVNREEELGRLRAEFERASTGERRLVFICGEAGIGKTALLDAFLDASLRSGKPPVCVARGQCVLGMGWKEEYYPVMEALGQLAGAADGESARGTLARMAPMWLPRLERQAETPPGTGSVAGQERLMGGLCEAIEEIAASKPLILILEDLHWADDATLNLISALARRRGPAKLLMVATLRPGSAAREHPLRALKQDLSMRKLCSEIGMKPLGKTAVRTLLSKELQQEGLPEWLGGFVHQHSEGNPLFAIAIVEHLIEQRVLVRHGSDSAAHWELDKPLKEMEGGVPAELAQMVELEIEQVSAEEQLVLEAGSLMNVAFPAWAVAAALGTDALAMEETCDGLARRLHFVKRGGQDELPDGSCSDFYVFSHEIYREVLYQRQSPRRRARGHIRIAERLGEMFKGREADVAREMAGHFEAAGSWQRAADALHAAARRAQLRRAHVEATELTEHARRLELNVS